MTDVVDLCFPPCAVNESDVDLVTALAGLDDGSQAVAPEDHDAILSTQPASHGMCVLVHILYIVVSCGISY